MGLFNINDFANQTNRLRKSLAGIDGLTVDNIDLIIERLPYPDKKAFDKHIREMGIKKVFRERISSIIDVETDTADSSARMDILAEKSLKRITRSSRAVQEVYGRMLDVVARLGTGRELSVSDELMLVAFKAEPTAARLFGRFLGEYAKDPDRLGLLDKVLGNDAGETLLASAASFDEDLLMDAINHHTGLFDDIGFDVVEAADDGAFQADRDEDGFPDKLFDDNSGAVPEAGDKEDREAGAKVVDKKITFDENGSPVIDISERKDDAGGGREKEDAELPVKDPEFENRITNRFDEDGIGAAICVHTLECKDVTGTFISDLFDDEVTYVFEGDVEFENAIFPVVVPMKRPREDVNEGDVLSDMRELVKEDDEKSEHLLEYDETRLVNRLAYLGDPSFTTTRKNIKNTSFNLDEFIELSGKLRLFESNDEIRRLVRKIINILKRSASVVQRVSGTINFGGGDFVDFLTRKLKDETFDEIEAIILELIDEKKQIGFCNYLINRKHIEDAFKAGKLIDFEGSFEYVTGRKEQKKTIGDEGSTGLYEVQLRYERYDRKPK